MQFFVWVLHCVHLHCASALCVCVCVTAVILTGYQLVVLVFHNSYPAANETLSLTPAGSSQHGIDHRHTPSFTLTHMVMQYYLCTQLCSKCVQTYKQNLFFNAYTNVIPSSAHSRLFSLSLFFSFFSLFVRL